MWFFNYYGLTSQEITHCLTSRSLHVRSKVAQDQIEIVEAEYKPTLQLDLYLVWN